MVEHNYLQSRTIDDSSSDEVEASDEEDEDAEEDSEQADVPEIQQLSISSTNNAETRMPKRSARSAKTAATLKIGKQLDDETNMNSKKNKRIYGEEDTNFDENAVPN